MDWIFGGGLLSYCHLSSLSPLILALGGLIEVSGVAEICILEEDHLVFNSPKEIAGCPIQCTPSREKKRERMQKCVV